MKQTATLEPGHNVEESVADVNPAPPIDWSSDVPGTLLNFEPCGTSFRIPPTLNLLLRICYSTIYGSQPRVAIVPRALRILPTMAGDDSSSDLSSLPSLSPPPSGEDEDIELKRDNKGILKFFQKVTPIEAADTRKSPPPRKREPSPPHQYVFADNPAIAVSFIRVIFATKREKARSVALAQPGLTSPTVHCHVSQAI